MLTFQADQADSGIGRSSNTAALSEYNVLQAAAASDDQPMLHACLQMPHHVNLQRHVSLSQLHGCNKQLLLIFELPGYKHHTMARQTCITT